MTLKNGTEKKEGKPMPKPWENAEGYHDPTAYHGTKNIIRDEDEHPDLRPEVHYPFSGV